MRRNNINQIFWGFAIILVGVLFLAQNLGYLQIYSFWRYLPGLLILFGLYQLFVNRFKAWTGPLLLTLIGTFLLLATLKVINWATFGSMIWPTILILVGISIILHHGESSRNFQPEASNYLRGFSAFSEQNRKVVGTDFSGAEITTLFGGYKMDLAEAKIAHSPARIQTTVMFGGVDLYVPEDWDVSLDTIAFFGGSSDKRKASTQTKNQPDLVITGTVFFGGLDIKSLPGEEKR